MRVINLTQHKATEEQKKAGVIDLPEDLQAELAKILTFDKLPGKELLEIRAKRAVNLLCENMNNTVPKPEFRVCDAVMIGGAPFFMTYLEKELSNARFLTVYSFSLRESVEETQPDGSVKKINIFRHKDFVPAWGNCLDGVK
jgi:hypothetical protein